LNDDTLKPVAPADVASPAPAQEPVADGTQVRVRFDDTQMASSYANVASIATTADEIMVLFGTNRGWNVVGGEITVGLTNRIIMTSSTARSLLDTLARVLETRVR
jgi:hypothetical protein